MRTTSSHVSFSSRVYPQTVVFSTVVFIKYDSTMYHVADKETATCSVETGDPALGLLRACFILYNMKLKSLIAESCISLTCLIVLDPLKPQDM